MEDNWFLLSVYFCIQIFISSMMVSWKFQRLTKMHSLNVTKVSLFFNTVLLTVYTLLPLLLQCIDPIVKNSHPQQIWHQPMNFSAHTPIYIYIYIYIYTHTHTGKCSDSSTLFKILFPSFLSFAISYPNQYFKKEKEVKYWNWNLSVLNLKVQSRKSKSY